MRPSTLALALAAALALPGCDGDHSGHGHADDAGGQVRQEHGAHAEGHTHEAPHGGLLVVCGTEFAHVELVFDGEAGELTAYCLGGHAVQPVRIAAQTVTIAITAGQTTFDLSLDAVGNALTGETVGDTSEFVAADDRLRGLAGFDGVIRSIELKGEVFTDVPFSYRDR